MSRVKSNGLEVPRYSACPRAEVLYEARDRLQERANQAHSAGSWAHSEQECQELRYMAAQCLAKGREVVTKAQCLARLWEIEQGYA